MKILKIVSYRSHITLKISYPLDGPGSTPGVEGWRFSSLLCVQTGPGVHSASYTMSTGAFPGGLNEVEHRTSQPTSS